MDEISKAHDRLNQATKRSPLTNPYGFFILDRNISRIGMFHWYEAESEMLNSIRNDLISLFEGEVEEVAEIDSIRSSISNIVDTSLAPSEAEDILLQGVNQFLSEKDSWASIEFIGTFDQLCEGNGDWAITMRQYYRGYSDYHENEISEEEASLPISKDERDEFAEVIQSYGQ